MLARRRGRGVWGMSASRASGARMGPSSAAPNSIYEAVDIMHRAGLHWERTKLGVPLRTIASIAQLPLQRQGNTSALDARGVPAMQQELLRLTWWSVYACRPQSYPSMGPLAVELAPRSIWLRMPPGAIGANRTIGRLAALLAPRDAARCARDGVETETANADDEEEESFFMNATCRHLVAGLLWRSPPIAGWCHFHREVGGLYRLGDVVERVRHQSKGAAKTIISNFNSSIAAEYLLSNQHGVANVALLRSIVKRRYGAEEPLEAVVHIRAGDTIESPGTTTMQFLCDRNALGLHALNHPLLGAYVKPLCYFESVADELQKLGVGTVVVIAGNHNPASGTAAPPKSCAYVRAVGSLLSRRFRVVYKLNLTADDSFAAAARARVFVPSGGGYSALIVKMVKSNGGKVVLGSCPLFSGDFVGMPAVPDGGARIAQSPRGWLLPCRQAGMGIPCFSVSL